MEKCKKRSRGMDRLRADDKTERQQAKVISGRLRPDTCRFVIVPTYTVTRGEGYLRC